MALILPYYHRRRLAAAFSLGGLMIIRLTVLCLGHDAYGLLVNR